MLSLRAAFNPAGGVRYHFRARLRCGSIWAPFREGIGQWLTEWNPSEQELVIIGSSGGYCLDSSFLSQFRRLICVDPDPLSPYLFRRRHPHSEIIWVNDDFWTGADLDSWKRFLDSRPGAAVLFSNFLGQLPFLIPRNSVALRLNELRLGLEKSLSGRSWASYHERLSGKIPPNRSSCWVTERRASDDEIVKAFYSCSGELSDHLTGGYFSADRQHRYWNWEFSRGRFHIIEGVKERHV